MEICLEVPHLTAHERLTLFHGRPNLWGSRGLGARHLTCQPPRRRFVLRDNVTVDGGVVTGLTVCHVGVGSASAVVNRIEGKTVWGIGGVVTVAEYQGRGYASRLLDYVLEQLYREVRGQEYALLFCLVHRREFYERRGWARILGPVTVKQPGGHVVRVERPYYALYRCLRLADPIDTLDLWSLPW